MNERPPASTSPSSAAERSAGGGGHGGRGGRGGRYAGRDLTQGSIPRNLWSLAWPQVIEGAMRVVDQMMDLVWAGLLGTRSIAGVGVSQQWTQLVWTGRQGLDTSMRAMVARAVGAGDTRLAQHVVFQGATLSVIFLGIITVVGILFAEPLLRLLRVPDGVVEQAAPYMRMQFAAQGVLGLQMFSGHALAASGDAVTPMRATIASRVVHMALSPFLVFGLLGIHEFGIAGAALASGLANGVGLVMNSRALFGGTSRLHLQLSEYRVDPRLMWQMARVGGPAAVTSAERSIAQLILVGLVSPFGDNALAAFTLTRRLEMFVNLGSQGLGQASGIIVGQSLGAAQPSRARQTILWAAGYVMGIKGAMTLFVFLFPTLVLSLFTRDSELLEIGATWVRIQSAGYLAMGISQVAMQSFQTAGDTLVPMLVTLLSIWGVQQPLALWLPGQWDLGQYGIAWAISLAVLVRPLCYIPYFLWGPWMNKHPLGRMQPPGAGAPASTAASSAAAATGPQAVAARAERGAE